MKQSFLLLSFFALFFGELFCQVVQPKRVEISTDKEYYGFEVATIPNKRILASFSDQHADQTFTRFFQIREGDLDLVKEINISFDKTFKVKKTNFVSYLDEEKNVYYYMLQNRKKGNFKLVTIDLENLSFSTIDGFFSKKTYPSELIVFGDNAYYTFSQKGKSSFHTINLKTGITDLFIPEDVPTKHSGITDMQLVGSDQKKELWVEYYTTVSKMLKNTIIVRFNIENKQLKSFHLNDTETRKHVSITTSIAKNGGYFMYGTYNSKKVSSGTEGFFIAKLNSSGKLKFIDYTNYLDLDNYTSYLTEKAEAKIQRKKAKKEKHGNQLNLKHLMTIHDIIEKDGQYILIGESYYPTYRQDCSTDANGNRTCTTIFDGYQYSHAAVCGYSLEGKLMWNQTFEMKVTRKPFYVKRFLTAANEGKQLKLMYGTSSLIKSISIYKGTIISEGSVDIVDTKNEDDKVKYTLGEVNYWYGKNFVSYGYQKIKNRKDKTVDRKRFVYFINKIKFM